MCSDSTLMLLLSDIKASFKYVELASLGFLSAFALFLTDCTQTGASYRTRRRRSPGSLYVYRPMPPSGAFGESPPLR